MLLSGQFVSWTIVGVFGHLEVKVCMIYKVSLQSLFLCIHELELQHSVTRVVYPLT